MSDVSAATSDLSRSWFLLTSSVIFADTDTRLNSVIRYWSKPMKDLKPGRVSLPKANELTLSV